MTTLVLLVTAVLTTGFYLRWRREDLYRDLARKAEVATLEMGELVGKEAKAQVAKVIAAALVAATAMICATVLGTHYRAEITHLLEGVRMADQAPAEPAPPLELTRAQWQEELWKAEQFLVGLREHQATCKDDHSARIATLEARVATAKAALGIA